MNDPVTDGIESKIAINAIELMAKKIKESAAHGWSKSIDEIANEIISSLSHKEERESVKFISYTGAYPNLCSGVLTLEIDGKIVSFGHSYNKPEPDYQSFWLSGGECTFDSNYCEHVKSGPWKFLKEELPTQYQKYADKIAKIFNENVPFGCCGGCI